VEGVWGFLLFAKVNSSLIINSTGSSRFHFISSCRFSYNIVPYTSKEEKLWKVKWMASRSQIARQEEQTCPHPFYLPCVQHAVTCFIPHLPSDSPTYRENNFLYNELKDSRPGILLISFKQIQFIQNPSPQSPPLQIHVHTYYIGTCVHVLCVCSNSCLRQILN
jgi:hypothetical protein